MHHILFVEEGEGIFEGDGKRVTVGAGSAVFIKKNLPSLYESNGKAFKTAWVCFDGEGVDGILEYLSAENFSVCPRSSIYPKILSCINLCKRDTPAEILSVALYDLVISYFTELNATELPQPIAKAKAFIEDNYSRDISVADISGAAGISQSLLFRLFKNNEGLTPVELLRQTRMKNACSLLISTPELPISDIAHRCGFNDQSYFCMVFKKERGMTPNTFRRAFGQQ
jgi:AraC-like DNA-binding protein